MQDARRTRVLVLLAFLGPLVWCFAGVLSGSRVLAYRDTAHFYYPLYHWLSHVWGQGEMPLWNPLENTGMPIAAEATAAVFYPGKLVFALPCSFTLRFHLYVVLHVVLAGVAIYCLARTWRVRPVGAGLAAIAYAFSGTVLFQYCNLVFLVGAAWLPLSLLAAEQMLRRRQPKWAILFGATLALMTLGGDPQGTYHAAMLTVLYALLIAFQHRKRKRLRLVRPRVGNATWLKTAPALLCLSAFTGLLLAAVQILPALSWTSASSRAIFERPRSLYEIPSYLQRNDEKATPYNAAAGLAHADKADSHGQQVYAFSVGPWRWPEAIWPNVSGRSFPENRRWISTAVPADGRVWTPSLYMGLLPLLLGLGMWRLRRETLRVRWMSWAILWSLISSLGMYGAVWLFGELSHLVGNTPEQRGTNGAVGGLYWFMVVTLPAYAYFRFPAKLLMITTLGLSLLAGVGLDRMIRGHRLARRKLHPPAADRAPSLAKWLWFISGLSGVALILVAASGGWWPQWLALASPDELFGPLNVRGAWMDAMTACCHATILAGILAIAVGLPKRWQFGGMLLLVITAIEIALANGGLILTAPSAAMNSRSVLADAGSPGTVPVRYYRSPNRFWVPDDWRVKRQSDRAAATLAWDRETLFPRFGLLDEQSSIRSVGTMIPYEYSLLLWNSLNAEDGLPNQQLLNALGTEYVISPDKGIKSHSRLWPVAARYADKNVEVRRSAEVAPRAWIARDIVTLPQLSEADVHSPTAQQERTHEVLRSNDQVRDLRQGAVVELPAGQSLPTWDTDRETSGDSPQEDQCIIGEYQRTRVSLEVALARPGLVVLSDQYWEGWTAWAWKKNQLARRVPILKTNRIMRGVYLPAGKFTILFEYRPYRQYFALGISIAAWLGVLITIAAWLRK